MLVGSDRRDRAQALFSLDAKLLDQPLPVGTVRVQQIAELGGTKDRYL
jgi:hypothetical protein